MPKRGGERAPQPGLVGQDLQIYLVTQAELTGSFFALNRENYSQEQGELFALTGRTIAQCALPTGRRFCGPFGPLQARSPSPTSNPGPKSNSIGGRKGPPWWRADKVDIGRLGSESAYCGRCASRPRTSRVGGKADVGDHRHQDYLRNHPSLSSSAAGEVLSASLAERDE